MDKIDLKTIPDFPEYAVSACGRVFSYKTNRWLKPLRQVNGYSNVMLRNETGGHNKTIHRLVAMLFLPNLDNKPHVNHINGNKADNRVGNLEWCTASENSKHARDTGLWDKEHHFVKTSRGEAHPRAKLTAQEVRMIFKRHRMGAKIGPLAREYQVNRTIISNIVNGKAWKEITKGEI